MTPKQQTGELEDLLFEEPGAARCLLAPDGTVLRANGEWLRAAGLSREGALGARLEALFPGDVDLPDLRARGRGERPAVARRTRRVGGRERWFEERVAAVPTPGGAGLLLTTRELSPGEAREPPGPRPARDEAPLRDPASLLDRVGDAVVFTDEGLRIRSWNRAAENTYGYAAAEALGRHVDELLRTEFVGRSSEEAHRELEERGEVHVDLVHLDRWGARHDVQAHVVALRDAPGGASGALAVLRDVTVARRAEAERRRAETEAQETRAMLQAALASMTDAVFITDVAGRFVDFNEAFATFHRFPSRADCAPIFDAYPDILELFTPDSTPVPPDLWPVQRALRGEAATNAEFVLRRKDSGETWFGEYSYAPVRQDGRIVASVVVARDATRRKRSEEALREELAAKDQLARIALSVPGAIYTFRLGPDGAASTPFAAPAMEELSGIPTRRLAEDVSPWLAGVHADDAKQFWDGIAESARTGSRWHGEFRYAHPSKGLRWLEGWSVPRTEPDGSTLWDGFVMDVTDRKRGEQALAESEALYRSLFNLTPGGVVLLDATGKVQTFNDQACRQMGYTREEFARLRLEDIVAGEEASEIPRRMARILASGGAQFAALHRTKTGEVRSVLVSTRLIDVGGTRSLLSVWQDVTEHDRAERKLQESEERFRALIEKSTDMTLLLDADGRYRFWSPSATETLGWTQEQMVGRPVLEEVHPDDRARIAQVLGQLVSRPGEPMHDLLRYQHRDGSWRQIEATARNLLHDPAVQGIVVNSRDVTEQRLLEEQLRQAQKLESVGRLAGGVAHDFNNLLTVILSCAGELLATEPDAATRREDLEEIRSAATRATELTRQLLAFARKQVIAPVSLDLNDLVRRAEKLLRRVLGEDIELDVALAPGLWPVRADPGQMEQVILNLAVNARDAMPRGGRFSMETRNAVVEPPEAGQDSEARPGRWVRIVLRDTGTGMSDDVKEHLFEPFFTTKDAGQGTGLGLATVHGIVGQAGGHVDVESAPGEGTTFTISLPPTAEAPQRAAPPPTAATRGTETVLVVEDDPQVRRVTVRSLERAGYQVLFASNGAEALEAAQRHRGELDLVITDVVMPGLGGRAVVGALERIRPGIRVLYVSGYTQDAIASKGVLDDGIQFLPKPFTPASLVERVRHVLGEAR